MNLLDISLTTVNSLLPGKNLSSVENLTQDLIEQMAIRVDSALRKSLDMLRNPTGHQLKKYEFNVYSPLGKTFLVFDWEELINPSWNTISGKVFKQNISAAILEWKNDSNNTPQESEERVWYIKVGIVLTNALPNNSYH